MSVENQLADAIESGAWYPILGIVITGLVSLFKRFHPVVFALLPTRLQWIPAVVLAACGSFALSFETGDRWLVAVIGAFTAAATAIGTHHTAKRAAGAETSE
jgi:hypothetical protein